MLFLDFVVGNGELKNDPENVTMIKNWPRSKTLTEVRNLMGACQNFIKYFSVIVAPLHDLTKTN